MLTKLEDLISFFAEYPSWVIISSIILFMSSITILIVFNPKKKQSFNKIGSSLKGKPMLHIGTHHLADISNIEILNKNWKGPLTSKERAKKIDFIEAVNQGYPVLHIEAPIGEDYIEFEDGRMTSDQLKEVLSSDLSKTELVILSGCNSFSVGKALDDSKVTHSVVAITNLETTYAATFYETFYSELSNNATIEDAYERAKTKSYGIFGTRNHLKLSKYHPNK